MPQLIRVFRYCLAGVVLAGCAHEPPTPVVDPLPVAPKTGRGTPAVEDPVAPKPRPPGAPDLGKPGRPSEQPGGVGGKKGVVPPPAPPAPIAAPGTGEPRPPAAAPVGIHQVSSSEWTVTNDLVDAWKASPGSLGRVRKVEGGWEVYSIRQRAGYHLGLRNGDIITEVNGHRLETKTQQLGAWFDLRNDDVFDVVFLRAGRAYSYTYRTIN